MSNDKLQLTSTKVLSDVFEEFKVLSIKTKFNFQKLANRTMHMYVNDENFRKTIHDYTVLTMSGSL